MRTKSLIAVLATAAMLTACSNGGEGNGAETGGSGESDSASDSATALRDALSRVDDFDAPKPLRFGHRPTVFQLADQDPAWEDARYYGSIGYGSPFAVRGPMQDEFGIDPDTADYLAITADDSQQQVSLIVGNQDATAITEKVRAAGYTGDGTLAAPEDSDVPYARDINQVRAEGDSAFFGYGSSDLDVIDGSGPSLLDNDSFAAIAECLGDSVVVDIRQNVLSSSEDIVAVGVEAEDSPRSIICAITPEDPEVLGQDIVDAIENDSTEGARANIREDLLGNYSDWFSNPEYSVDGDVVRVTMNNTDGTPVTQILSLSAQSAPMPGMLGD